MSSDSREKILQAAKQLAQARGYGGLNFRDVAGEVGIRAASMYHHFPTKADLGAAVARRYWEDSAAHLEGLLTEEKDPTRALSRYPETFRWALANQNRMCLCSFMAAEYDDLPDPVKAEVRAFTDVNVAWLRKTLVAASAIKPREAERRARAIFAAVTGAQLVARGRADVSLYDELIDGYRAAGLLPG